MLEAKGHNEESALEVSEATGLDINDDHIEEALDDDATPFSSIPCVTEDVIEEGCCLDDGDDDANNNSDDDVEVGGMMVEEEVVVVVVAVEFGGGMGITSAMSPSVMMALNGCELIFFLFPSPIVSNEFDFKYF